MNNTENNNVSINNDGVGMNLVQNLESPVVNPVEMPVSVEPQSAVPSMEVNVVPPAEVNPIPQPLDSNRGEMPDFSVQEPVPEEPQLVVPSTEVNIEPPMMNPQSGIPTMEVNADPPVATDSIPQSVDPNMVGVTDPSAPQITTSLEAPQMVSSQPQEQPTNDNSVVISDQLEKVEIVYKPISKFKVVALIFLFVFFIGFILFLPDITSLVEKYMSGEDFKIEKITTGKLKCLYDTTTANLDKSYNMTFSFKESKLKSMEIIIVTRGDASADEEELDTIAANCKQLQQDTESLKGFYVRCSSIKGTLTETQSFDLADLDSEKLSAAFFESGGTYPEFDYDESIDKVEKNMNASGYNCSRES